VTVLAAIAEAALTLLARGNLAHGDLASQLALAVAIAAYATLGALIVRQTGNLIGWIMLAAGAEQALLTIASIYAVIGIATFPGSLPAAKQVGTLAECTFPAVVFTVAFMFLLFPTGALPSRRWRPVAAGRGVDPGRRGAVPGRDLAARITPVRRRHGRRRRRPACFGRRIARGRRYPWRRAARRTDPAQATERVSDQHRGRAHAAPGVAGGPGPAQRRAGRRAAGHDR
jgi:hypothetical protein